ncbi:MAG: hypothetical protein M1383_04235 [Patescibacteria group bacterium]|nr:hypothetical protein [Patescibacteria group bacterium]
MEKLPSQPYKPDIDSNIINGKNRAKRLSRGQIVIIFLLVLLIVAAIAIFLWWKNKQKTQPSEPAETAGQIRDAFGAGQDNFATSTAGFVSAFPGGIGGDSLPVASSSLPGENLATALAGDQPIPNPGAAQNNGDLPGLPPQDPSAPLTENSNPLTYANPDIKFQASLPSGWSVAGQQPYSDKVLFYNAFTGQLRGYLEFYQNSFGETLDSLSAALRGSPEIQTVNPVIAGGRQGVQFTSFDRTGDGIAVIANNKIYYLRGELASPDFISGIKW